jgi:hypothetical protein
MAVKNKKEREFRRSHARIMQGESPSGRIKTQVRPGGPPGYFGLGMKISIFSPSYSLILV